MVTCRHCNNENMDGNSFCQNCGRPIYTIMSIQEKLDILRHNVQAEADSLSVGVLHTEDFLKIMDHYHQEPMISKCRVPATASEDGTWLCPDCGWKNPVETNNCINCQRYK